MSKQQFVDKLSEGDRINDLFLVNSIRLGETKTGKAYLVITVSDKTGEISGPVWDNVPHYQGIVIPGNIIHVKGVVASYQNSKQLKLDGAEAVPQDDVDLGDFLVATPFDREEMGLELQHLVHSVEDVFLRKLLLKFFNKNTKMWNVFQDAPAAKGMHHAYIGGLLEHSLSVTKLAVAMAEHYAGVDRSLLLTGALLHDIGKIKEMTYNRGVVNYTSVGRLKGHLVMGSEMVAEFAAEIKDFPTERLEELQHLILSHHSKQEFGSPIVPMTVEAILLGFVDDIDAKINITEQLRHKMDTPEAQWTDYQRGMERFLYLKGYQNESGNDKDDPAIRQLSLY
ncbi:MAG: HD domain-containing protein [Desulfotalea sp.]